MVDAKQSQNIRGYVMTKIFDGINARTSIKGRMRILGVLMVLPVAMTVVEGAVLHEA